MKDYVIINGVSSKTKTGLAINILPPITKPKMRTLIEEIDGRDGDIITKLGYSAYNKTIEIGLFGNGYDVDDIIAFFNKEGTIIFSNEPTKYYNFTLIDSFDIERLLQFKTATITFHCQPFKYEVNETPAEIEYEYVNGEGTEITLNNTKNALMELELLPSELTQASTPTPDSPQEVQVIKGNNSIKIENKNLLDNSTIVKGRLDNGVVGYASATTSLSYTDTSITFTTNADYRGITSDYIEVEANTDYVYSQSDSLTSYSTITACYDENKTYLGEATTTNINDYSKKYTTKANTKYFRINIQLKTAGTTTINQLMIEKGSTASTYVAHQEQVLPLNLGTMEYCKIGNYEDEFEHDLDTDKWYINKNVGKTIITVENVDNLITDFGLYLGHNRILIAKNKLGWKMSWDKHIMLCDRYSEVNGTVQSGNFGLDYMQGNVVIWNDNFTDLATAKTELIGTVIYIAQATTKKTEITNSTLISQLNAIEQAVSYDEQTNISQTNAQLPFRIKATAMVSGSESVEINNNGNIYAKPILDIKGSGTINIYLNGTQMLSVSITDEIIIDVPNLESYNPNTSALMNRNVTGDISKFVLPVGTNTISVDGDVELVTITLYKRWI